MAGRTPEHYYCWDMAERVMRLLVSHGAPCEVVLLREEDEDPTNAARAAFARIESCDIVLSLHVNSGPPAYHGAHAFHFDGDKIGRELARMAMASWPPELSRRRQDGYRLTNGQWVEGSVVPMCDAARRRWPRVGNVFRHYVDQCIVLVELFYATNDREDRFAQSEMCRSEMALALMRAVVSAIALRGKGAGA